MQDNIIVQNIKSSIAFLRKHSIFSADIAEGQLKLLLETNATDQELRDFGKDLDAANDVWR